MFKNAKVGDKVWSILDGWGEIVKITNEDFPIKVKFKNGSFESFITDGSKYYNNINPTLFWDEVKFEIPKLTNTDKCEDVKIEYPIYKRNKTNGMIVKFINLTTGIILNEDGHCVGSMRNHWIEHTNTETWEDCDYNEDAKFKYPIYKLSKVNGVMVVKFTGLTEGVVVDHTDKEFIGCVSHTWIEHTDEDIWEDVRHKKLEPTYYKWERLHINNELIETSNFVTDAYAEKYNFESNGWRKIENSKRSWEEENNHS